MQKFIVTAVIDGKKKTAEAKNWYQLKSLLDELANDYGVFTGRLGQVTIVTV